MIIMKKLLLIKTGGTIACIETVNGLSPDGGADFSLLSGLSGFSFDEINLFNLDSSDISPEHWKTLARTVFEKRFDYGGFVITHGTDTMQYSAAALSLMLENFDKPVIFTGSQRPPCAKDSDAPANLFAAFKAAQELNRGIFITFGGKLINGLSAVKINSQTCEFADAGFVYENLCNNPPVLRDRLCEKVFYLKITPAVNCDIVDFILEKDYRGVICEAYGLGGIPQGLLESLGNLVKRNIRVIIISQCLYGSVDINIYTAHRKALDLGLEAWDMTGAAALVKLMLELTGY